MPDPNNRRRTVTAASKAFIPLSDELLYEHPERLPARLVPYEVGMVLEIPSGRTSTDPACPPQGFRHED